MTPDDLVKIGASEALKPYANLIEKLLGPTTEEFVNDSVRFLAPWVVKADPVLATYERDDFRGWIRTPGGAPENFLADRAECFD